MSIEKSRAHLIARIWQAVAQSGVDLSSLSKEDQGQLVSQIADTMLVTMNEFLEEEVDFSEEQEEDADLEEQVIWQGRPFLSLVEFYTLTSERLKIVSGLLSRQIENFELIRIQDIDLSQGATERIFGIGDITIRGQDASQAKIVLRNVSDPEEVYELLRRAWIEARKRHGLQFREYM